MANLLDVAAYFLSVGLDILDDGGYGLVDTAFEVHGVGPSGDVLQTGVDDGLSQNGSSGGAVASLVVGLRGNLLHHLGTHVLDAVLQFDFLSHGHTVLSHLGSTKFLVDNDIAAFRAEGYFYCVCQCINALAELFASVIIENYFFCHFS